MWYYLQSYQNGKTENYRKQLVLMKMEDDHLLYSVEA
jgi:hypothetical protein